jgi:hypothetical protein
MQEFPEEYAFPAELVQAVLNYLGDRPYREVAHLIGEMREHALRQDADFAARRKAAPRRETAPAP